MDRVDVGIVWDGVRLEWGELGLGWSGAEANGLGWFAVEVEQGGVGMGMGWTVVGLG